MIQRLTLGPALFVALLAAACSTTDPTPKQVTPKGPQFDADYYSKNAKEYVDAGHYGQAKDQWQKQLIKDPDNWMAQLGIAYCDYFLSEESVVQHANLDEARVRLKAAESRFHQLRSGPLEADTDPAKGDPAKPQWKAELGLALTQRRLGVVDNMDANRHAQLAKQGGPEANQSRQKAQELEKRREISYAEAINSFTNLAYMQHASPEAIKNLGELYIVTKQDAKAEVEYRRFLDLAQKSAEGFEQDKKNVGKTFAPNTQEAAIAAFDAKLASNAQKRVAVMMDLADLAYARGDYTAAKDWLEQAIKLDPDRRDLYLKLAQCEQQLGMLESALQHVDEFLRRSSARREEFGDQIRDAMKLRAELDGKLKSRGGQ